MFDYEGEKLRKTAQSHGGYLSLGEVASTMGWCSEVAEVAVFQGVELRGVQPWTAWLDEVKRIAADCPYTGVGGYAHALKRALRVCDGLKVWAKPKGYTATYRKWAEVLTHDTLTNSEIVYLGHRLGEGPDDRRAKITSRERYDLELTVRARQKMSLDKHYNITPEQTAKGISWLNQRSVQTEIRKADSWGSGHAEQLARTVSFKFSGYVSSATSWGRSEYIPLYTAFDEQGNALTYWAKPWPSTPNGMRFSVINLQYL